MFNSNFIYIAKVRIYFLTSRATFTNAVAIILVFIKARRRPPKLYT